ncbi:hypothetical protein HC028_15180 [Planosporangium flavigriseum]|uniref:Uncharacterized protein n=1 Tax=Planosporangium flavigriseum TaxID=373681 RepID=A0A8J3LRW0_9ACTN|nr:hypothetical protein [Planosporangium flavigriseum]NJC65835.1 hypothetical protein [Planosporangium flavigriseum]GIG76499.1 hypothetical protein Pfl04_49030 [Planosporangium flavigriseum]
MSWRGRRRLALWLAALIAGWGALAVMSGARPSGQDFDKVLAKSAEGALSAVRTAQLAGQAELDGRATRTYLSSVLDDALRGVVTAQQRLAQVPPPDRGQPGNRDELLKLLHDAARATGDLVAAVQRGDDRATRFAVDALGPIGDRLAGFVERHQQ